MGREERSWKGDGFPDDLTGSEGSRLILSTRTALSATSTPFPPLSLQQEVTEKSKPGFPTIAAGPANCSPGW